VLWQNQHRGASSSRDQTASAHRGSSNACSVYVCTNTAACSLQARTRRRMNEPTLQLKLRYHATHATAQLRKKKSLNTNAAFLGRLIPVISSLGLKKLARPPACSGFTSTWQYHRLFSVTQQNDVTIRTWRRKAARDTRSPRSLPFPWGRVSPACHDAERPTRRADRWAGSTCQLLLESKAVACHNTRAKALAFPTSSQIMPSHRKDVTTSGICEECKATEKG